MGGGSGHLRLDPRCATANRATSRVLWPAGSRAMRRPGCVAYEEAQAGKKHAGQVPMAYQKSLHRERVYRHSLERMPYQFCPWQNWHGSNGWLGAKAPQNAAKLVFLYHFSKQCCANLTEGRQSDGRRPPRSLAANPMISASHISNCAIHASCNLRAC